MSEATEIIKENSPVIVDDLGLSSEVSRQDETHLDQFTSQHKFLVIVNKFIVYTCETYSLEKQQVVLGLILSILLLFFSLLISIVWRYYCPIIQEFVIKEEQEKAKLRKREEKEE